jgi:hypothetical protein
MQVMERTKNLIRVLPRVRREFDTSDRNEIRRLLIGTGWPELDSVHRGDGHFGRFENTTYQRSWLVHLPKWMVTVGRRSNPRRFVASLQSDVANPERQENDT